MVAFSVGCQWLSVVVLVVSGYELFVSGCIGCHYLSVVTLVVLFVSPHGCIGCSCSQSAWL